MSGRETMFACRRAVLWPMLGVSVFLVLQGLGTALVLAAQAAEGRDAGAAAAMWVLIAIGLPVIGFTSGGYALRRLRLSDPAIAIGPQGLYDRSFSERPIPWHEMRNVRVCLSARGGKVLAFDLADGASERAGVGGLIRRLAPFNRLMGYSYSVRHIGTEANAERLAIAMAPFVEVRT